MKKIVVLIICIFLVTGCKERIREKMPKDVYINTLEAPIEVYQEMKVKEIITDKNVDITNENEFIKTDKVGKREVEIFYTYNEKKYVYRKEVNIVDTKKPKIISGANKTTIVNNNYDICKRLFYGDNYDRNPQCEVEGELDLTTVGVYDIKVIITDSSNNSEDINLKINVIEEPKEENEEELEEKPGVNFSDVLANYKTNDNEIGIDVSRWQGEIDFAKVKAAGASFVIMRMGIQSDCDKDISVDSYFEKNYENAKANGLKVGIYLYTSANTKKMIKEHTKWMLKELKGKEIDLPIAFDWENWSKWRNYGMNFHDINEIADTFIKMVQKAGYEGMLYSSKFYLENIWENKNNYPVWLAHYASKTTYSKDYLIWQMTNIGRIDGINGDVDINILYNK